MSTYSVLGISIEEHTLREELELVFGYLESKSLNTVCLLDTELLMKIKDDEPAKKAVSEMDLLVEGSSELLRTGGITSKARIREVDNGFFLQGLLKKLAREKKRIFLIGNSQDELVQMRASLLSMEEKLTFFGSITYGSDDVSADSVINQINTVLPDVVISLVQSPMQELLVHESRQMVNTALWVSLQQGSLDTAAGHISRFKKFLQYVETTIFRRTVKDFDNNKTAEDVEKSEPPTEC